MAWRRPTPAEEAHLSRELTRLEVAPYNWRSTSTTALMPARVVLEEARVRVLYYWDDDAQAEGAFGYVGGLVGQLAGNPSKD